MNKIFVLVVISIAVSACSLKKNPPLLLKQILVYSDEEQSEIDPDTITLEYNQNYQLIKYEAVGYEYYLLLDSLQYDEHGRVIAFRESDDSENPYGGSMSVKRIVYNDTTVLMLSSLNYTDQDKRYDDRKLKIDTITFKLNNSGQPIQRVEQITRRRKRIEQTTDYTYVNGDYADPEKMIIPRCLNPYYLAGNNLFWALLMNDVSMGNLHYWENTQCSEIELSMAPDLAPAENDLQYPNSITLKNCNNTYYKTTFVYSI